MYDIPYQIDSNGMHLYGIQIYGIYGIYGIYPQIVAYFTERTGTSPFFDRYFYHESWINYGSTLKFGGFIWDSSSSLGA